MNVSQKMLIDYWIEIGKVRRERAVLNDPTSRYIYFFKHELVEDLALSVSWSEFFKMFDEVNHGCFLKELEGEVVENPFDPWRNPSFVGISFRIKPPGELRPYNRQVYQLIEVITIEN